MEQSPSENLTNREFLRFYANDSFITGTRHPTMCSTSEPHLSRPHQIEQWVPDLSPGRQAAKANSHHPPFPGTGFRVWVELHRYIFLPSLPACLPYVYHTPVKTVLIISSYLQLGTSGVPTPYNSPHNIYKSNISQKCLFRSRPSVLLLHACLHSALTQWSLRERCCLYMWVDPEDRDNIFLGHIAHLQQQCHNSKFVIFQEKI